MTKTHVKKGDMVTVLVGKDRGATAKVIKVLADENMVVVEGVNVAKKHQKPRGNVAGQIIEIERPIHISNVMLFDAANKQRTRTRRKSVDGKFVRVSVKTDNQI